MSSTVGHRTKVVSRWANEAAVPVKPAVMAFGYALNRYAAGYSPQAVRLFMPPLDELDTEDEFNHAALEVERQIVKAPGLQRWRATKHVALQEFSMVAKGESKFTLRNGRFLGSPSQQKQA